MGRILEEKSEAVTASLLTVRTFPVLKMLIRETKETLRQEEELRQQREHEREGLGLRQRAPYGAD